MKLHKLNKLDKTAAYNTYAGAWVLTTRNRGPIEIVIEVRGERELAYRYAKRIVDTFNADIGALHAKLRRRRQFMEFL